jgi:hypothetical protein
MMHPSNAALPNHPTSTFVSANCFSTNSTVPEMTAVSKPKRNPPREATKQIQTRKGTLPCSGMSNRAGGAAGEVERMMALSPEF